MKSFNVQAKLKFEPNFPLDTQAEKIYQTLALDELVESVIGYKINDLLDPELRLEFDIVTEGPETTDVDSLGDAWVLASNIFLDLVWAIDLAPTAVGLEVRPVSKPALEDLEASVQSVKS